MPSSEQSESSRLLVRGRAAIILAGIAALVLAALVGLSYQQWRNYQAANAATLRSQQALESVDSLLADLLDAETGQRGYLLTGEDRYLEPYNKAIAAAPAELIKLKELLANQDGDGGKIARLSSLIDQKLGELRLTID